MSIQIRKTEPEPKQAPKDFRAIKGRRSLIDREKIKRENHEKLLASVGDGIKVLGDVIRNHHAKQKAAKILSEE